jgi:hypothetical protein
VGQAPSIDLRSHQVEEQASDILAVLEVRNDITLVELRLALAKIGLAVSVAGPYHFFERLSLPRKKDWPSDRAGLL